MITPTGDSLPPETCAGCGGFLGQPGPEGGCLRCLLSIAYSSDGNLSVEATPSVKPAGVQRSQYGHFEVAVGTDGLPVELGSGAMATTFRAQDTVLRSAVALKVINKSVAERPAARTRFLREARAAAKLRHPNVAGVTFYGEHEGECYYVMELVEGETLEARVRREGPLSPALALEVGIQVAQALAAAEACGIVHRDLKPSNLMLAHQHGSSDGGSGLLVVKVIDWGLAKAVNADPALGLDQTRDGFVGTPAFASPEQFDRRENRHVDTRSDIYSLGVTLWYLLCGHAPFVAGTLEAIHTQQKAPPYQQLATVRVPKQTINVLKAMLALDPAARPQSARELLDALRLCQDQLAAEGTQTGRGRRYQSLAIALGVLVVPVIAGVWWYNFEAKPIVQDRTIAVLPFENLSPDKVDAPFTTGVREEIAKDLTRVPGLRVTEISSTRSGALQALDPPQIARFLGMRYLLNGSIRRADGQVHVSVRLWNARDLAHPWSARYDRPLADVFAVRSEITQAVAAHLGVTLSAAERTTMARPPTSDLTAYGLYLRVHESAPIFQSDAEKGFYYSQIALPLLEEAVARDPKFVLAHCDLALIHDVLMEGQDTISRGEAVTKGRMQAEAELAIARQLQPDGGEVHLTQARHFAISNRLREEARTELDLARRKLPDSVEVESLAGEIAYNQNRWDEATRCFERAATLDPHNVEVQMFLMNLYRSLRRYHNFDAESALLIASLDPQDSLTIRLGGTMSSLDGRADPGPLRAAINVATPAEQTQVEMMNEFRLVLALCEHDPDAVSGLLATITQPGITICGIVYPKSWFAALAARMRRDEAGAHAAFELARAEVNQGWQAEPRNGRILGLLAMIDAGLGQKDAAVREALHACELCPVETAADQAPIVACDLAVVYAWTGQPDPACAVLEEWIKRPAAFNLPGQPTYGDFRLNSLWDPLRGNSRFAALVARLAPAASR